MGRKRVSEQVECKVLCKNGLKLPGKGHPRCGRKLKVHRERRRNELEFDSWCLRGGLSSFYEKWLFGEGSALKEESSAIFYVLRTHLYAASAS